MPRLIHEPGLPRTATAEHSFLQRIEMRDGRHLIGYAVWHLPGGGEGVVQLVELTIDPAARRKGHASTIFIEAVTQAHALCKLQRAPLRRIWVAVAQKTQVLGRAFLTRHGFHHTATIPDLLHNQDVLVYLRSFD